MIDSRGWKAVTAADGRLRVTGTVIVPTSGWGAELRPHESRGDDRELVLDLAVERPTGPVLQVISAVPVGYEEPAGTRYERVSILPDGPHGIPVEHE